MTPESLRTPTITVEALKESGIPSGSLPPPVQETALPPIASSSSSPSTPQMAEGHMQRGHFMPDPVVSTGPVRQTGIFVQAGSFAVYSNAERLTKKLVTIAPTIIEPVTVGTQKLYRVKLGPIASVEEADGVLEKVIRAGMGTAKVVKVR